MSNCCLLDRKWFEHNFFRGLQVRDKKFVVQSDALSCCKGVFSCFPSDANQVYVCSGSEKISRLNSVAKILFPKLSFDSVMAVQHDLTESTKRLKEKQCKILPLQDSPTTFLQWIVVLSWALSEEYFFYSFRDSEQLRSNNFKKNIFIKLPQKLLQSHHLLNFITIIHACYSQKLNLYVDAHDFIKKNRRKRRGEPVSGDGGRLLIQLESVLPADTYYKLSKMLG